MWAPGVIKVLLLKEPWPWQSNTESFVLCQISLSVIADGLLRAFSLAALGCVLCPRDPQTCHRNRHLVASKNLPKSSLPSWLPQPKAHPDLSPNITHTKHLTTGSRHHISRQKASGSLAEMHLHGSQCNPWSRDGCHKVGWLRDPWFDPWSFESQTIEWSQQWNWWRAKLLELPSAKALDAHVTGTLQVRPTPQSDPPSKSKGLGFGTGLLAQIVAIFSTTPKSIQKESSRRKNLQGKHFVPNAAHVTLLSIYFWASLSQRKDILHSSKPKSDLRLHCLWKGLCLWRSITEGAGELAQHCAKPTAEDLRISLSPLLHLSETLTPSKYQQPSPLLLSRRLFTLLQKTPQCFWQFLTPKEGFSRADPYQLANAMLASQACRVYRWHLGCGAWPVPSHPSNLARNFFRNPLVHRLLR